jgi:hypothetical protein
LLAPARGGQMAAQSGLLERGATDEDGGETRWWVSLAEKDMSSFETN